MSLFGAQGFDTIIGKGTEFSGNLNLNGVCVIDGLFSGGHIKTAEDKTGKTHLLVNGSVTCIDIVMSDDLTISGSISAKEIRVEGNLIIKKQSVLKADKIFYKSLAVEPSASIEGQLIHL